MSVYTNPPEWEAQGKKPPSSKRTEGWKPGDRVHASWLNWFWFSTVNSLREIAQAFVSHVTDKNNPHGVTVEQIGAAPSDAAIPIGGIIMWSGSVDSIPPGWALCDGRNGTPDLRDRFIVGAGGSYNVGNTGGRKEVTLTTSQLPTHTHTASISSSGTHNHTGTTSLEEIGDQDMFGSLHTVTERVPNRSNKIDTYETDGAAVLEINPTRLDTNHSHAFTTSSNGSHSHSITISSTGGGQAHENRPPYYALCFIMKL